MTLPKEKQDIVESILNDLKAIKNVRAIVLGGSYATGTATSSSDLDVGIYYFDQKPFAIEDIKTIAEKYAVNRKPTVTGFYEWGAWVNGGAWINTANGKVDLLYKNIDQITTTIEKAKNGIWETDFEQQPPYGFSSIIYLGESKICLPLYDPDGIIKKLKAEVLIYPPKLKQTVIQQSLWSAEFAAWQAGNFSRNKDLYATMGCLARAVNKIVTALFSMNEIYPTGDKRAIESLEKANLEPVNLKEKIENILSATNNTTDNNITLLKALLNETIALTAGTYKPFYNLADFNAS